jgi:hypothetical protein
MDFKLKCIKTKNSPIGAKAYKDKVYIFEDGRTTWENGIASCRYDSAEDFFEHNINLGVHFEEVKEMKELTFKEVIANIKEGEVWECEGYKIRNLSNGDIQFVTPNGAIIGFRPKDRFNLSRKEYTFEEAFKALEEGKEIESTESHAKYKKIDDCYKTSIIIGEWIFAGCLLNFHEIKGKWYINEVD